MVQHPYTFALDIGTRSVVGIILEEKNDSLEVLDIVSKEHEERAMLDGQIHDVLAVSNIINEIKEELEQKHGTLTKVCVAAAGRALKTKRSKISSKITGKSELTYEDIVHMELSAVQQAQFELAAENNYENSTNYYCVGYSVIHYGLDDQEIGSLIDQKGDEVSVEIIATFLPKVVVESLIAALNRANLEMEALTLEPIAAMNVLIPPSMRRLNVALVDIGAGTSDIAITDIGTVVAYGMVPVAGDEITEAISDQYLLDFHVAEKSKRDLHFNNAITIHDILGFEQEISRNDVLMQIEPALDKLASEISEEILTLNKKSPKAVMLVGGGSLTPQLPERIAKKLQLPDNRVAIRGIDAIQKLKISEHIQQGPELVTPIGIAIAAKQKPISYINVTVNDVSIRLFDMKQLTVGDCLLSAGIEMNKLYGKPGMAIIVNIDGRELTLPGLHGEAPCLYKNDDVCSLNDTIEHGDKLTVKRGKNGDTPKISVKELFQETEDKTVWVNGQAYEIGITFYKGDQEISPDTILKDHDKIETRYPITIRDLLNRIDDQDLIASLKPLRVTYNGSMMTVKGKEIDVKKNGLVTRLSQPINDGDQLLIGSRAKPTIKDILNEQNQQTTYSITIMFNNEPLTLTKEAAAVELNGKIVDEHIQISDGDQLHIIKREIEKFIFQDIFRYVQIELPNIQSGRFTILKNGKETGFDSEIVAGDKLQITWPDREISQP
ncbi:cell division protein FtsA [Bacillus solimangrovi]|uniref:Cell division protein n=1 Tax=Bacillus solimangrovi TaxID=1305675 RepID=A0A1E5LCI9_9BACI|nr:cell division protein FtsA [Bacillus solimangrovi]OEH91793.1 cell division protein [Bacillus solimangrovi]